MKYLDVDDNRTMDSGAGINDSSAATTGDIVDSAASQGRGDNQQQEEKAQGMDSQCHENTPMDSECQKIKLESAMNQLTLNTGLGNLQAPAGMNNRQPLSSMSTATSNQELAGSGVETQNHQSPALGMNNEEPIAMAMKNQELMISRMSNQPGPNSGRGRQQVMSIGVANQQATNSSNRRKSFPLALLLPSIQQLLDRDKTLQLQSLYQTFKRNEIAQEAFVRRMRTIVGDRMLKMALYKAQQQAMQVQCNLKGSVNGNVCATVRLKNAPMAEMPNNPPLQRNAFQFYTGNIKEQKDIAPLFPMTYAKSEAVENVNPENSKSDGFEMQFSKLGVSACTSKVHCDIPGWLEWDDYAPSREEKLSLKANLEQLGRLVAEKELELAECKVERDLVVDKNLVLEQELENEKIVRKG